MAQFLIQDVLTDLGFARNEARIYETLLREGESGVTAISSKAGINRRNVYDSIDRLIEKGVVFEVRTPSDNRYSAVAPSKLMELVEEKRVKLSAVMPEMGALFYGTPHKEEVFIYKGIEGWKNYMRDMLRIGEDNYTIGGAGAWNVPSLAVFYEHFVRDAKNAGMSFHVLWNPGTDARTQGSSLPNLHSKILPEGYHVSGALDIFGDRVVTLSGFGTERIDADSTMTVIVNRQVADAYRTWFRLIWDLLPPPTQETATGKHKPPRASMRSYR